MDTMFIFLLHRKTNSVGSSTAVRTLFATYSILGAQQMCVKGGPAPEKACLDCDKNGCPCGSEGGDLQHLRWTILDFMDTTEEKLVRVGHQGGPKCRCNECQKFKNVEDKWICRMGTFYGSNGLNTRDEIKARSRVNFIG